MRRDDTETSMLLFIEAPCTFKDLMIRGSAIRITYRISLRSSSSQEPRYPLLKVVKQFSYAPEFYITVEYLVTFGLEDYLCSLKVERVRHPERCRPR